MYHIQNRDSGRIEWSNESLLAVNKVASNHWSQHSVIVFMRVRIWAHQWSNQWQPINRMTSYAIEQIHAFSVHPSCSLIARYLSWNRNTSIGSSTNARGASARTCNVGYSSIWRINNFHLINKITSSRVRGDSSVSTMPPTTKSSRMSCSSLCTSFSMKPNGFTPAGLSSEHDHVLPRCAIAVSKGSTAIHWGAVRWEMIASQEAKKHQLVSQRLTMMIITVVFSQNNGARRRYQNFQSWFLVSVTCWPNVDFLIGFDIC